MNKKQELDAIKQKIIPILEKYRVIRAGIFGSYARGEQKKNSDIDILIEIDKGTDLIELIQLKITLEKEVKRKVDVVEYAGIRKELKKIILNDEVRII